MSDEASQANTDRLPFSARIRDITTDDLLKPLKDEWLTYNGDYTSRRYSALNRVNRKTSRIFAWPGPLSFRPAGADSAQRLYQRAQLP